jgi:hypothetical protein
MTSFLVTLVLGLGMGGFVVWYWFVGRKNKALPVASTQTISILEKVQKVFKVVLAEGHFSEIIDYKHDQKYFFDIFNSSKKALIIVKAKVLVGYDIQKLKFEMDEVTKEFKIHEFPQAEILAIDPEYQFYDSESGFFNKFNNKDYTELLGSARMQLTEKAMAGELPKIAQKQIVLLLDQIIQNSDWKIKLPSNLNTLQLMPESKILQLAEVKN